jgi:predicted amino acid dehydrogenase
VLPHLIDRRAPWFAFLLHFREHDDLYRVGGSSLLRRYSGSEEEFKTKMCSMPPLVAAEVTFGFAPIRGEVVGIMRMPEEMIGREAVRAVVEGVELAATRGARVVGLGALTASATRGGERLLAELPRGVLVTNGNAYTAAVVRQNVVSTVKGLELGRTPVVAIVGCTGSVGVPATRLVAEEGYELVLVGRTARRVERELGDLDATFAGSIDAVHSADLVVLLTSDPAARLRPEHVREGATVIDFAHPVNLERELWRGFHDRGVSLYEGAGIEIPHYRCNLIGSGFGVANVTAPACLAETYLIAKEGIGESSVGRPSLDFVHKLERVAARHGVHPAPLKPLGAPEPRTASAGQPDEPALEPTR